MSSSGGSAPGTQVPQPSGPPYLPPTALLGGLPTVAVDDPICAVLLFLFVVAAAVHMTVFQVNLKRDHKFVFSVLLFGFCMARITALVMRIVWASYPTNLNVAVAANIFVAAGVLILYIVNLIFAQRLVRAYHPHFGWRRDVTWIFRLTFIVVGGLLIMVITATVHSFFTLDANARVADRTVQLVASTFLAALAFAPVPIVLVAALIPRVHRPEKFGQGRFRAKLVLLLSTSTLLAFGAGFRTGVAFDARPITQPAWFHHKAVYYVCNYGIELLVVYAYAIARFDRRFHVPDGSHGPGHYAGDKLGAHPSFAEQRINTEADVFGGTDFETDTGGPGSGAFPSSLPANVDREKEVRLVTTYQTAPHVHPIPTPPKSEDQDGPSSPESSTRPQGEAAPRSPVSSSAPLHEAEDGRSGPESPPLLRVEGRPMSPESPTSPHVQQQDRSTNPDQLTSPPVQDRPMSPESLLAPQDRPMSPEYYTPLQSPLYPPPHQYLDGRISPGAEASSPDHNTVGDPRPGGAGQEN